MLQWELWNICWGNGEYIQVIYSLTELRYQYSDKDDLNVNTEADLTHKHRSILNTEDNVKSRSIIFAEIYLPHTASLHFSSRIWKHFAAVFYSIWVSWCEVALMWKWWQQQQYQLISGRTVTWLYLKGSASENVKELTCESKRWLLLVLQAAMSCQWHCYNHSMQLC